jgi:uncharacterized protein
VARGGQVPRPRHVPQRTCVACRQGGAKRDLVRIVRTTTGAVQVDPTGKLSGRGAYLCQEPTCWQAALTRGVLPRALKLDTIPEDDLRTLTQHASHLSATSA